MYITTFAHIHTKVHDLSPSTRDASLCNHTKLFIALCLQPRIFSTSSTEPYEANLLLKFGQFKVSYLFTKQGGEDSVEPAMLCNKILSGTNVYAYRFACEWNLWSRTSSIDLCSIIVVLNLLLS